MKKYITSEDIINIRSFLVLSQQKFAKKLGVHANTVSLWERGKYLPSIQQLQKIKELCEEYNIDISKLKK